MVPENGAWHRQKENNQMTTNQTVPGTLDPLTSKRYQTP
jgi:hypothetical protein